MREYLINADFDLSLRPNRAPDAGDRMVRQAREMPYHLLFLGSGSDSVLVESAPGDGFLASIERAGLCRPVTSVLPTVNPAAQFVPFGWNQETAETNRSYARPAPHPPLDVVRRVNGRRYAAELERELFAAEEVLGVFESVEEIETCVATRPENEGWLLKSEHGNAGLGNRRLRSPDLGSSDREVIGRLLREDACVLLEKWRRRSLDISTVFTIGDDGTAGEAFTFEVVNTADGAYLGSYFEPASESLERWRPAVAEIASKVARRLAADGYFGPVCLDHFVWANGGDGRLRPLADINARLQMSAPMLRLWRSWNGDRVIYWRLFSSRKLGLPTRYPELERALGADAFDAERRRGVLVTSPFEIDGRRLRRIGVLLAGTSRAEVDEMDRRLRERFEK